MDEQHKQMIKQDVFAGLNQLNEADAYLDMVEIAGEPLARKIMQDTFVKQNKHSQLLAGIVREIAEAGR